MKFIQTNEFSQSQLDPDSCAYLVSDGDKPYIVFARMKQTAQTMLRDIGENLGPNATSRAIGSLTQWPFNEVIANHRPEQIKTVIVCPVGDDTNVYIIDHLPETLIEFLSAPLPSPQTPGSPNGVRVFERLAFNVA